jgi:drug/metabolite transporter (DMT)-like permease
MQRMVPPFRLYTSELTSDYWREPLFAATAEFKGHLRVLWHRISLPAQQTYRPGLTVFTDTSRRWTIPVSLAIKATMKQIHSPLTAAFWMVGAILAFSAMAIAGRAVSAYHDTFEIMTWRSLVGFIIVAGYILATGQLAKVRHDRLGRHFLRNIAHFTGQNLWFLALTLIPLAQVIALEFTSPIWVILLAPLFLGETLNRTKVIAATLGFVGTLIVARPDFSELNIGVLAAATAAICFATTAIFTKSLTRHESILSILFWLTLMQLIFGILTMTIDGAFVLPNLDSTPLLIAVGISGLSAHYCLTTALSLAPASTVMPIDFMRLPLAALIGLFLYDETPEIAVLFGAGFILLGIWINLRSQSPISSAEAKQS